MTNVGDGVGNVGKLSSVEDSLVLINMHDSPQNGRSPQALLNAPFHVAPRLVLFIPSVHSD